MAITELVGRSTRRGLAADRSRTPRASIRTTGDRAYCGVAPTGGRPSPPETASKQPPHSLDRGIGTEPCAQLGTTDRALRARPVVQVLVPAVTADTHIKCHARILYVVRLRGRSILLRVPGAWRTPATPPDDVGQPVAYTTGPGNRRVAADMRCKAARRGSPRVMSPTPMSMLNAPTVVPIHRHRTTPTTKPTEGSNAGSTSACP